MIRSISRSRSMAAPAATASTSAGVADVVWSAGAVSSSSPGASLRITWPTTRGRITVSSSIGPGQPGFQQSQGPVGRGGCRVPRRGCGPWASPPAAGPAARSGRRRGPGAERRSRPGCARTPRWRPGRRTRAGRRRPRGHPDGGLAPHQGPLAQVVQRGGHVIGGRRGRPTVHLPAMSGPHGCRRAGPAVRPGPPAAGSPGNRWQP